MSSASESPPGRFSSFQPGAGKLRLLRVLPWATRTLLARGEAAPAPQWWALRRRQNVLRGRRRPPGLPAPLVPAPQGAGQRQDRGARSGSAE